MAIALFAVLCFKQVWPTFIEDLISEGSTDEASCIRILKILKSIPSESKNLFGH